MCLEGAHFCEPREITLYLTGRDCMVWKHQKVV